MIVVEGYVDNLIDITQRWLWVKGIDPIKGIDPFVARSLLPYRSSSAWFLTNCGAVRTRGTVRDKPSQGGGRRDTAIGIKLAAIVFVATSGCIWRQLPAGVRRVLADGVPAVRRIKQGRVRAKLHRVMLHELGARGELDWSRCAIDSVGIRATVKGS